MCRLPKEVGVCKMIVLTYTQTILGVIFTFTAGIIVGLTIIYAFIQRISYKSDGIFIANSTNHPAPSDDGDIRWR